MSLAQEALLKFAGSRGVRRLTRSGKLKRLDVGDDILKVLSSYSPSARQKNIDWNIRAERNAPKLLKNPKAVQSLSTTWITPERLDQMQKGAEKPFHGYNPKVHARTGGLSAKGRAKFKREQGSNLKAPVTEKNPTGDRAKRRKSFCARMSGMPGPTSEGGKLTRKGAALKRWRC